MNKEDFYKELGNIDPEYIEEAELSAQTSKKVFKISAKKWIAAAAAFIIMAGAASTSEAVQAAIKKMFTFIKTAIIKLDHTGRNAKIFKMSPSECFNANKLGQ